MNPLRSGSRAAGAALLSLLAVSTLGCSVVTWKNEGMGGGRAGWPTSAWQAQKPRRIAVLPFVNEQGRQDVADVARLSFAKHVSVLPFEDVEVTAVDREAKVGFPAEGERKRLGQALGADTLVRGRLMMADHRFALIAAWNVVRMEVEMQNAETGEVVWRAKDTATGISFGLDPISWAFNGYRELIWWREWQRRLDDLCRDMTRTIPQG